MYACVYVPNFLLQVIVRAEPALRVRAVAITDGTPPLCRVVTVNQKARQAGVKPGISKLEAAQLPDLVIRQRSPMQEAAAHAALVDLALGFSPRVEATAPDTVVLDLAGVRQLFGAPAAVARNLLRRASALGLNVHVAVAANIDAAIHAARGLRGIALLPEGGGEAELLGELPLEVLEPPPEIFETLRRWGVHTFGALGALPAAQLSERLGQEGVRLQALACGRTSRPLVPVEPALEFEEVMELEYSVTLLDPLAFILGRMLDQLCRRLEARSLATNELRLRLELENTAPDIETGRANWKNHESGIGSRGRDSRNLRLPVPTRNPKLLLKLCLLHLKADPPQAPILKVMLTAQPAKPRVAQGGLFLPLSPHPEKLELTLARIAGVVGKERAGSPELEDSHQPDAFRMNRFHPGELRVAVPAPPSSPNRKPGVTSRGTPNSRFPTSDSRHLMTLRFFRPPQPATVELVAGRPVRVFALGVHGDVIAASGPWRNSGSWWRDDAWEEDEWDIEVRSVVPGPWSVAGELSRAGLVKPRTTDNGLKKGLYRIYRESPTGSWFIRGIYD